MKTKCRRFFLWIAICFILLLVVSCSSTRTLVVLLPNDSGANGAVTVGDGDRTTLLDIPMTAAKVDAQGRVQQSIVSQDIIDNNFSQALAALPPEAISFILYFEEGNTVLLPKSMVTLSELFEEVDRRQAIEVQITGHTDSLDSEDSNDRLSVNRAEAIKKMLITQGLQTNFIRAVGRGERELLVQTPDGMREPQNRRVEVIIR
ncbi:OmpA family protein [Thermodesulfobacteriota bacterium]